jgi:tetratricopeptide (TPR) repeat protein
VTWISGAQGVRVWDNESMLFYAHVKLESDPLLTGDYLDQAADAIKNKEYDKAIAILKHVEQLDPDLASIYNLRGVAYYQLKDVRRAVDEIKRAVQIDPTFVQGYVNLGDILRIAGDWSSAVKNYTRAIELKPDGHIIYNNRGVTYFKWGEQYLPKAIEDFSKAIELKPDYATAFENRGNMYYILKDFPKALDDYREYARLAGSKANQTILERIAELEAKKK